MDTHLEGKDWLAGGQYTIADIANFSWVFAAPYAGEGSKKCCMTFLKHHS